VEDKQKIGLILEQKPSAYSRSIRAQIVALAQPYTFDVEVLEVDLPADPDLIRPGHVDGIFHQCEHLNGVIVLSSVLSHRVGVLSRFAQHWAPRPMVSIGHRIAGVASVLVDNRSGQRLAAAHLIEQHGRKQLLYIRGRRDSIEAEDRYLGYRRALHEHGILFQNSLLLSGDFTAKGAVDAMGQLAPDVKFDGVVAANDDMALAVAEHLKRRGQRVPQDVAIIGFDDVEEARTASPPLASIAQPFAGLAREALQVLHRQLTKGEVPLVVNVPVKLVARASCGCL
jgi:DNA-binding LacI/PurR family transcriptional regulator